MSRFSVVIEINGVFTNGTGSTSGGRFLANAPMRLYGSREGDGPLRPVETRRAHLALRPIRVVAIVLNVTVTNTTAASYLTAWPRQTSRPLASDLSRVPRLTVPNLAVVGLGSDGSLNFNAGGSTSLVLDQWGELRTVRNRHTGGSPARLLDDPSKGLTNLGDLRAARKYESR